ncbi:hypothetical protein ANANG_G00153130 [Anguilla anguilla]|uniref:Uncharacterized protein n=1 Tax=Anguilla anguilla TaxID=7936 RepID=A0A9D3RUN7_ANGAN|nr:hypothetical protein ANANG_G00153130 [Anguilla anguilla]
MGRGAEIHSDGGSGAVHSSLLVGFLGMCTGSILTPCEQRQIRRLHSICHPFGATAKFIRPSSTPRPSPYSCFSPLNSFSPGFQDILGHCSLIGNCNYTVTSKNIKT